MDCLTTRCLQGKCAGLVLQITYLIVISCDLIQLGSKRNWDWRPHRSIKETGLLRQTYRLCPAKNDNRTVGLLWFITQIWAGKDRRSSLQWRHKERSGVWNHRRLDCLLNRLFRRRSKKTSKLRVTGFCDWNSPDTSMLSIYESAH